MLQDLQRTVEEGVGEVRLVGELHQQRSAAGWGAGSGAWGSLSNKWRMEVMRSESRWECFSMSDSCCDRAASWHLTVASCWATTPKRSLAEGSVGSMWWLGYYITTRTRTQGSGNVVWCSNTVPQRGVGPKCEAPKKSQKMCSLFPRAKTKSLSIQSPTKIWSWKK